MVELANKLANEGKEVVFVVSHSGMKQYVRRMLDVKVRLTTPGFVDYIDATEVWSDAIVIIDHHAYEQALQQQRCAMEGLYGQIGELRRMLEEARKE